MSPTQFATSAQLPPSSEEADYGLLEDALVDRVQLGVELLFPLPAEGHAAALAAALGLPAREGEAGSFPAGGIALRDWRVSLGGAMDARVQGRIGLAEGGQQLAIRGSSHIIANLMRVLREALDEPVPVALDGATNLIGLREDYRPYFREQLRLAEALVDAIVGELAGAVGLSAGQVSGRVWVQQVEICRDLHCAGAEAYVSRLADWPVPGARSARERRGNGVCLSWHEGGVAPAERKIYAKCADLIRFEVALRSRKAVVAARRRAEVVLPGPAAWGRGVALELAAVARAVMSQLEEAEDFSVLAVTVQPAAGHELVVGVAPLAGLAWPSARQKAGRPRGEETVALARRALALLLDEGCFDARGIHSGSPVLAALSQLREAGILLPAGRAPRLFTLAPRFEPARQALRGGRPRAPPLAMPA